MSPKPKVHGFRTNAEKIRSRAEKMEKGGLYWKPNLGLNRIRILPPWNDQGIFYLEERLHYGFKDASGGRAYPCIVKEGKCPACQLIARFKEDDDLDVKKIIRQMKPKAKFFMNVIDRKEEVAGVRIFGAGFKITSSVLGYFSDPEYGDITDPDEGRDVIIEKEGSGLTTSYAVRVGAKPTPVKLEGWENMLHNLTEEAIRERVDGPTMLQLLEETYPELDLSGIKTGAKKKVIEESEDSDEEEETPKAKKKTTKTTDDDLDDEDDDDD